ncbi:MAG: hypothetical protein M1814_004904 [Vezdaea aestivalis]|nr:MAG: hypothetical protein M1814_004904 [Vezdaea aestivalis]
MDYKLNETSQILIGQIPDIFSASASGGNSGRRFKVALRRVSLSRSTSPALASTRSPKYRKSTMIRHDANRVNLKRKVEVDPKKRQFAESNVKQNEYPYRLNFYDNPPTAEITLDQFEQWAIDRLKILAELESCQFRNRSPAETETHMKPFLDKYLPLSNNSKKNSAAFTERQRDHYSHFILRLAFASTEELRRRFCSVERSLFRLRFKLDDAQERAAFVAGLNFDWEVVGEEEKRELAHELLACTHGIKKIEDENWFKVDWDRVPELVESRRVLIKRGRAYVPVREQITLVVAEFGRRLDENLTLTARALPRLDEDDRLAPILSHLSKNFGTPDNLFSSESSLPGAPITAANINSLVKHFPLCMSNLHTQLRKNSHLKHFGRLQYTFFLKGIGLSLEECIRFWRGSFSKMNEADFNRDHLYNVRHAYGDVGGDSNRRSGGHKPYSCQKILTEQQPGSGDTHGCPYRHFSQDNLISTLQSVGVVDRDLLKIVRDDVSKQRFHIACGRVFDHVHQADIKKAEKEHGWGAQELDTIAHPNVYFKRSYTLKNLGKEIKGEDVEMKD